VSGGTSLAVLPLVAAAHLETAGQAAPPASRRPKAQRRPRSTAAGAARRVGPGTGPAPGGARDQPEPARRARGDARPGPGGLAAPGRAGPRSPGAALPGAADDERDRGCPGDQRRGGQNAPDPCPGPSGTATGPRPPEE